MQNQYNMWDIYIWRDYMQKNVYIERLHAKEMYIRQVLYNGYKIKDSKYI